ncbi:DNA topoisomerase I [Candidatus Micrarchaeota archaeon]|nr:DNA topoisomerase I [Candidatus Micrarchaeota archaeon]
MNILVIAEKPKVAEKIASALGKPSKKIEGGVSYYELTKGKDLVRIASAVGHLYSLKSKEKGSTYPVFDIEWVPSSDVNARADFTKKYFNLLKKLVKESDVLVNACDYDVEGSLIGGNVIRFLGKGKDAKRMLFNTLTADDLRASFDSLKKLDESTISAGETRHILDWLWGINASRALITAIKKAGAFRIMSIGRVQGPSLHFLAEREKQILSFVPKKYWVLSIHVKKTEFLHEKDRFFDETEAQKALNNCSKEGIVKSVQRKKFKQLPPKPFDLTALQLESYKVFGFAPTRTLQLAQELYEAALISYPRTSSQKLPAQLNLKKIIEKLSNQPMFSESTEKLLKQPKLVPYEGEKSDPAHPAIHPTGEKPSDVSAEALKLFELIGRRFLACFGESAVRERQTVLIDCGEKFSTTGSVTIERNWFEHYEKFLRLDEITLPEFTEGEKVKIEKLEKTEKETQPPNRFTPASAIKKLESLNLGTKATRASIIQTLFDRNYLSGKSIEVTPLGLKVADSLSKFVPQLTSEELTRHFEEEMEDIQNEKRKSKDVIVEGEKALMKIVEEFKANERELGEQLLSAMNETQRQESLLGKCAKCEKGDLAIKKSRFGLFVGCNAYPECKTTYSLPRDSLVKPTGKTCEFCKVPIITVIRRGKRPFNMCLTRDCKSKESWTKKPYVKKEVDTPVKVKTVRKKKTKETAK